MWGGGLREGGEADAPRYGGGKTRRFGGAGPRRTGRDRGHEHSTSWTHGGAGGTDGRGHARNGGGDGDDPASADGHAGEAEPRPGRVRPGHGEPGAAPAPGSAAALRRHGQPRLLQPHEPRWGNPVRPDHEERVRQRLFVG